MIIFRPNRRFLDEAMKEAKEYQSLENLLQDIALQHNNLCPFFTISIDELSIKPYGDDERVGWHDLFIISLESYDRIYDKEGYKKYFGGETYNHPCGVFGFFSTDYDRSKK